MTNKYFSLEQKIKLSKSLFTKTSPAYVQFYITARCNLACEQCNIIYADASSGEMNLEQIKQVAKNLSKIGVCIVLLIGGEPFMRSDIDMIVKAFCDEGIHVRMQTNGLATKEKMQSCISAGAHDISVSLDSLAPSTQETINGGFVKSWHRAINTVSVINELFPLNGSAFFGTVLMPDNIDHIKDVIEFATKIGWGVSLVPAHISTEDRPQGFRTFDKKNFCRFTGDMLPRVKMLIKDLKVMKKEGFNLYDSDEYLDDIYRFIAGEPIKWRERNNNVCDSPNLYFAIEPNGNINPCCDFKLGKSYPVYEKEFPSQFFKGVISKEVYKVTTDCSGCMYGSYPEISITARYLKPLIERFFLFNKNLPKLQKYSFDELVNIAQEIYKKNHIS